MQNSKRNFTFVLTASLLIMAIFALDKKQVTKDKAHLAHQHAPTIKRQSNDRSKLLFDAKGNLSQALTALLELTGIQHDGSLASAVEQTQQQWLRATGKERWQINELFPEKRQEALLLLDELGCIAAVQPTHNHYDYAIILGASVPAIRIRLSYLAQLWQDGVHFENLIFLGGARPLDPQRESASVLLDTKNKTLPAKNGWQYNGILPTTEITMMQFIYDQADLPKEFMACPVKFISTPLQKTNYAANPRNPNTADIITTWLAQDPMNGTCLFISNNPYIGYQDAVVRTTMPQDFIIETVGNAATDETKLSVFLDNCARWLYTEKIRQEKR